MKSSVLFLPKCFVRTLVLHSQNKQKKKPQENTIKRSASQVEENFSWKLVPYFFIMLKLWKYIPFENFFFYSKENSQKTPNKKCSLQNHFAFAKKFRWQERSFGESCMNLKLHKTKVHQRQTLFFSFLPDLHIKRIFHFRRNHFTLGSVCTVFPTKKKKKQPSTQSCPVYWHGNLSIP